MTKRTGIAVKGMTLAVAAGCLWPVSSAGHGHSDAHFLVCGQHRTIGEAVKTLKPGDTLRVSGTCDENLTLDQDIQRITLDGQGSATINGAATGNTITVTGLGITIRGFTITGGAQGIAVLDGGSAVIDGNTIENAAMNGITVFRNATAQIINNTIQNNTSSGIQVQASSVGRIGFTGPPSARVSMPNLIQGNGATGIQVLRASAAQIFSNTIQNNGGHGVLVDRNAQAEIGACLITGNTGDGIRGTRNAGLDIGTDASGATPQFDDDTNTGTNGGFGVRCMVAGYMDGRLGKLTGAAGGKGASTEGCVDSVVQ